MSRRSHQSGAALLVLGAILAIGVCAVLVSAVNSATLNETTTIRKRNAEALQEAKSALIGYVAKEVLDLSNGIPGRLPCPESPSDAGTTSEGRAGSTCDPTFPTNKNVGRLPWRTLGLDKLVDASSEPLWYVVSPAWVLGAATPVINSGTAGQLTVDGTADVVAIIVAPGRPLSTNPNANQTAAGCQARNQSRNDRAHNPLLGGNPNHLDYLECENASIDFNFGTSVVENATNAVLNDQVVTITAKDILNAIQGPVAERMQRTVAPLLSEFSDLWPGGNFLPYAVIFAAPESNLAVANHCGTADTTEGLLPIAPNSGTCISTWGGFSISGSVTSGGCTPQAPIPTGNVRCTFTYYRLTGLGAILLGGGVTSTDVTVQATAPHAAASFRMPLQASDIIVPAGVTAQAVTFNPQTDGDARLSLQVRVTGTQLCDNLLLGLVCNLLPGVLATSTSVSVEFPQLATPILQGTKLSAAAAQGHTSIDLLNPVGPDPMRVPPAAAPHYWFMQNQWYRYTYYAVSPNASAAATGGNITVNGFPTANGGASDKNFVLAVVGPAVTRQVRGAAAALSEYLEGENFSTGDRIFAQQVYAVPGDDRTGNDRIATCPFIDGTVPCD